MNRVDDRTRHIREHLVAVILGRNVVVVDVVRAAAKAMQQAVIGAGVNHIRAGLRATGFECRVALPGVFGEARACADLVCKARSIRRRGRPNPSRARIDDIAQHAGARAKQADAECSLFVAAVAAQEVQSICIVRSRIAGIQGGLLTGRTRSEAGKLERDALRAVPAQNGPGCRTLGGHAGGLR